MKIKNKKAQSTIPITEKIIEYMPWIIILVVLIVALFLLKDKLGIT